MRGNSSSGMPVPVSDTVELDRSIRFGERDADRAVERELERVRRQIEHDVFPHLAIDVDGRHHGIAVDLERETRMLDRGAKGAREVAR